MEVASAGLVDESECGIVADSLDLVIEPDFCGEGLLGFFRVSLDLVRWAVDDIHVPHIRTPAGRAGFGILLFQDMAAIPLIALLPLLGPTLTDAAAEPGWLLRLP